MATPRPSPQTPLGLPKPRRGRPRLFETPSELRIRLDASLHDRLIEEASRQGKDVSAYARELLDRALHRTPPV